jgi:hypothetical protein
MIHSHINLRYFLLSGPVSLEPFLILKECRTEWHGHQLIFCALGVSHAVTLQSPDRQLTEFLSCAPAKVNAQIIAEASACLPWEITTRIMEVTYRCRITILPLSENDMLSGRVASGNQMEVFYPIQQGFATPATRIGWHLEPDKIFVETVHTYPEESRVVRSESVFDFGEDWA